MSLTHALSTNNYGPAAIIVATSPANGTHTTLASAMSYASAGQTIFLRDSVTENVTITPGVNIACWDSNSANTPTITGTLSMTGAGTSNIYGITLVTNSAPIISVTGSNASILILKSCYLNCTNNDGITFSSSSSSAQINIINCRGDLGTTGIRFFAHSSAGSLTIRSSSLNNSGSSTTASTISAGSLIPLYSQLSFPITASGTGGVGAAWTGFVCDSINTTCLTLGGSTDHFVNFCVVRSGTASAISIGGTAYLKDNLIISTNTNAITGAGTLNYANMTGQGNMSMNTTTQNASVMRPGITRSNHQPAFLAYLNTTDTNVTGDGTVYTIIFDTEVFDQNGDFNLATSTFTAPYTGKYTLNLSARVVGATNITNNNQGIVTSNRTYRQTCYPITGTVVSIQSVTTVLADMDIGDTCTFTVTTTDSGGKIDDVSGLVSSQLVTWCSGSLFC